jgi:hypothetical protein
MMNGIELKAAGKGLRNQNVLIAAPNHSTRYLSARREHSRGRAGMCTALSVWVWDRCEINEPNQEPVARVPRGF